ncbi:aconitate hydratase AcnA [Paraburkholderia sp. BL25I1N1]|uniref:aconitate hydratase AcnA n=1 Tax=Paraburkholderia sp. BL25I1N1 TaxID=1938804 RepID=UPI000D04F5E4|nr:aconitate hydratase AcnA [Paraburkholderia sp. BL25I1N1]PRY04417.1 aconitase [Paraburkholderia sp. BL25I1N1]
MENTYAPSNATLTVRDRSYRFIDLPTLIGPSLKRMPVVLRYLLENVVRNTDGDERQRAVEGILEWCKDGTSETEIAFQPGRVLMHDTTSTPALVDIAGMRDALAEVGADPESLNPVLPVDSSVDHSLAVEYFAQQDAVPLNLALELRRNEERYRFLRWASKTLHGVRIHPPGTGIMHTINLEQLATVVTVETRDGETWAVPDTMIGTDSHTPMVNGIGVLGWGVGGLEAQTVMFGMPVMQRVPDVIGVRLTGALRPGSLATDVALTVTHRLRNMGVSGEFVEFFGPGVSTLSAGDRAVIANMAPEYGASTGFFPVDDNTLEYLRATKRREEAIDLVETFCKRIGVWFDPEAEPMYTRTLEIDLAAIGMHVAGPRRPQDLLGYADTARALREFKFEPQTALDGMPAHPVAIAAITSCTNTSDPALLIAAGLVARKARQLGLRVAPWVKTSLGPGSPAAGTYLERAGLIDDLSSVGFDIVGYGCTTCIGNSGSLTAMIQDGMAARAIHPVAVLSGNRNFPGRIHPDLDLGFIMSPPLVIAFALAGDAEIDISDSVIQTAPDGSHVRLADLWPTREEVAELVRAAADPNDYPEAFALATANPLWAELTAPESACFPWDPTSTALRRPPFASFSEGCQLGRYSAYPLLVVGDDVTTDHISPASAIPETSFIADYLVDRGDDRNDLNVFASRRGNWEVMVRAAFYNRTLVNLLHPGAPVGHTLHVPSAEVLPIFEVAQRYRDENEPVVLIAGERYGMGSSRDWAAKGQRLLGIRAVLAVSFERIHRSNLIGMGILPLRLPPNVSPGTLNIQPGDRIEIDAPAASLSPRCAVEVTIVRIGGRRERMTAGAAVETALETELLRLGGVIPLILQRATSSLPSQTKQSKTQGRRRRDAQ